MLKKQVEVPMYIKYSTCLTTGFFPQLGFATIRHPTKIRQYAPTNTRPQNHQFLVPSPALYLVQIWRQIMPRVISYWKVRRHNTLLIKNILFVLSSNSQSSKNFLSSSPYSISFPKSSFPDDHFSFFIGFFDYPESSLSSLLFLFPIVFVFEKVFFKFKQIIRKC